MNKTRSNKRYDQIKSELHRAKDKISFLSTDIERLEEENATLRANLAEAAPMYPAHYHEEKHAAFQLGKDTQRSLSKSWGYVCFGAGIGLAVLVELIINQLK